MPGEFTSVVCSQASVDAFEQTEVYEDPSFKEGAAAFERFDKYVNILVGNADH
jgi:hypothetical protein